MQKPLSCTPTKRTEQWWLQRHAEKVHEKEQGNNEFDIVILGDSIVHAWELEGEQAWQKHFAHLRTLNLGFAGDRTEHLLWRIENNEVAALKTRYAIVLIGTNNAGHRHDSPEDIALGIQLIINSLQGYLPSCQIVLTAIFPRSRNPKKRMRKIVDATNKIIHEYANGNSTLWFDINRLFLQEDGTLDESVMSDLLHLNSPQYDIWATQLTKILDFKN